MRTFCSRQSEQYILASVDLTLFPINVVRLNLEKAKDLKPYFPFFALSDQYPSLFARLKLNLTCLPQQQQHRADKVNKNIFKYSVLFHSAKQLQLI